MAVYVTRRCPHCGYAIESGRNYQAIGPSEYVCPSCHEKIVLDHIEEWEGKSALFKGIHAFALIMTIIKWGFAAAMLSVIAFVLSAKHFGWSVTDNHILALGLGVWAAYAVYRVLAELNVISESKGRTRQ